MLPPWVPPEPTPIRDFLKSAGRAWWALMSCAAFTILGLAGLITGARNDTLIVASFGLAVAFVVVASYLAWRGKYFEVLARDEKLAKLERENERLQDISTELGEQTKMMRRAEI